MEQVWWNTDMPIERGHMVALYEMALALYRQNDDQQALAKLYHSMGISHLVESPRETHFLQQALVLYRTLCDMTGQIQVVQRLLHRHNIGEPAYRLYLDQALVLYGHIEDEAGLAQSYTTLGALEHWQKNYKPARTAFQTALDLFADLEDHRRVLEITIRLYKLIVDADGQTAAYQYYEQTRQWLRSILVDKDLMMRWLLEIAQAARIHRDFRVARAGFQQALMFHVTLDQLAQQAQTYWIWGLMEYHDAEHKSMGFHLCQRAATISKYHNPERNDYQKKLDRMRREMQHAHRQRSLP
jgi:hypothetical protein